jgi:hypothetical protein
MGFLIFLFFLYPLRMPKSLLYEGENPFTGWALYDDLTGPHFFPIPITLEINGISFHWIQNLSLLNTTPFEKIEVNPIRVKLTPYYFKEDKPFTLLFSKRGLYDLNHLGLVFGRPIGEYLNTALSFDYKTVTPYSYQPEKKFNQYDLALSFSPARFRTEIFLNNSNGETLLGRREFSLSYISIGNRHFDLTAYSLKENSLYNLRTEGGNLNIRITPPLKLSCNIKYFEGDRGEIGGDIGFNYEGKFKNLLLNIEMGGAFQEGKKISELFDLSLKNGNFNFRGFYKTLYLHPALPIGGAPEKRFLLSSQVRVEGLAIEAILLWAQNLVLNGLENLLREKEGFLVSLVPTIKIPLPYSSSIKWSMHIRESNPPIPLLRKRDFSVELETKRALKEKEVFLEGRLILSYFGSTGEIDESFSYHTNLIIDLWNSVRIEFVSREFLYGDELLPGYPFRYFLYRLGVSVLLWD